MKINPTTHAPSLRPVADRTGAAPGRDGPSDTPATKVSLSAEAVRSLDSPPPERGAIRPDVVADIRAALAAGTYEQSVDLDKVMNSLLADL